MEMAGKDSSAKITLSGFITGFVQWIISLVVYSLAAMLVGDEVLARFNVVNPGFGWYAAVLILVAIVVWFVRAVYDIRWANEE